VLVVAMTVRWWLAPAKLNLFLHVVGRRADGYHELQTYFQLLDWGDEVGIEVTPDGAIERLAGPAAIPPEQDLSVRAAHALQAAAGIRQGARLQLRKRIPTGGGLGGGSSDAATVLRVLDRLWGCNLGVDRLAELGLALGADVPVFVRGQSALGEGRGERLIPANLPENDPKTGLGEWFLLLHPGIGVSTAEIFQAPELTRNSSLITIRALSLAGTRNDCEPVVRARYPAVAEALDWLARFAPPRMTGTGACIFARFARAIDAERVAARVPAPWRSYVARGVQRSPLLAALDAV
jgi:4-diphosphocytidyl-2-C-methyl-D-erythritol kinase